MQILRGTPTHAHNLRHFSLATSGHGNHVYFAPNVVLRTLVRARFAAGACRGASTAISSTGNDSVHAELVQRLPGR